jgi:hypothetical protein
MLSAYRAGCHFGDASGEPAPTPKDGKQPTKRTNRLAAHKYKYLVQQSDVFNRLMIMGLEDIPTHFNTLLNLEDGEQQHEDDDDDEEHDEEAQAEDDDDSSSDQEDQMNVVRAKAAAGRSKYAAAAAAASSSSSSATPIATADDTRKSRALLKISQRNASQWHKYQPMLKSYLSSRLHFLANLSEPTLLRFTLRRLEQSIHLLAPFPVIAKLYLRVCCCCIVLMR